MSYFVILNQKPTWVTQSYFASLKSQPNVSVRHQPHSGSICHNTCGMNIYQSSGTIKISESEIN